MIRVFIQSVLSVFCDVKGREETSGDWRCAVILSLSLGAELKGGDH